MERENRNLKVLVVILCVLVLGLGGYFFYDVVLSDNTINDTQNDGINDDDNTIDNENNVNINNVIPSKLINNLNNSDSETTFNGITVEIKQSIEDMVCYADIISINGYDVRKDNGICVDSYEFFDDNVIIMSHNTSGSVFTIYNTTSNSTVIKFAGNDNSLNGYFVESYSINNNIITLNASGCGAQCGEQGIENSGYEAIFEIEYSNKTFSNPILINKTKSE